MKGAVGKATESPCAIGEDGMHYWGGRDALLGRTGWAIEEIGMRYRGV